MSMGDFNFKLVLSSNSDFEKESNFHAFAEVN